jgi:hypothetical protein
VTDDHVKAVLVVHDGAETSHAFVHVLGSVAYFEPVHAFAGVFLGAGRATLQRSS